MARACTHTTTASSGARTAKRRLGALASVALLGAAALAPAARAAGPAVGLEASGAHTSKGYFVYHLTPGAPAAGTLKVTNPTGRSEDVHLYAVDGTTGQTSGAVYESGQSPRHDVGAWLHLSQDSLTLAPNQAQAVTFTLAVPGGARAGEHLGGIVAQTGALAAAHTVRRKGHGSFRVNIQERTILAVQIDLPGANYKHMSITDARPGASPGYQTLLIGMTNDGRALTKGSGRLTIAGAGGHPIESQSFYLDTFVPDTHIEYPAAIAGHPLAPGDYLADVALTYGHGHTIRRDLPFTVTAANLKQTYGSHLPSGLGGGSSKGPGTPLLILGAVGLLLAGFGGSRLLNRRQAARSPSTTNG